MLSLESLKASVEAAGIFIDFLGVVVIILGILYAIVHFVGARRQTHEPYRRFRHDLGRGILLGLEFLVAADIIRTVAVSPTVQSVTVLAMIVVVRTFLSVTLQIELEGRLPWKKNVP